MENENASIQKVVEIHKGTKSFTDMADAMNEIPGVQITRPRINNWALGISQPDKFFIFYLATTSTGWIMEMCVDMLKVLDKDLYNQFTQLKEME